MSNEQTGPAQQVPSWDTQAKAERWGKGAEQRQRLMGEATRRMLEAAGLKPGDHVLDIAAGTGDQSRLAAQIVAPGGTVIATDISAEMLRVAARLAQQEGLTNITTREMNAEQLDFPDQTFNAVISRLGLMLVPDLHRALSEIDRVLKPGGRLAALVWAAPERNPFFSQIIALEMKYSGFQATSSNAPGPFRLGDPAVFERALKEAGFHEVNVQTVPIQFRFPSSDAGFQVGKNMVTSTMEQLDQEGQQRMNEELGQIIRQFEGPEGFLATGAMLLGLGSR